MKLIEYFKNNQNKNEIDKWHHYFDIYETHFNKFIGKKVKVLEIGIANGGSLQMWKEYFGPKANIIGIDNNPECFQFEEDRIKIYIGDQSDRSFLKNIIEEEGCFDIIIDDGSHMVYDQKISFQELYSALSEEGIYLCEDLHTNYWPSYMGGLKNPYTFIEMVKNLIDELNAFHYTNSPPIFTSTTKGIHIYDSIVVFEKQKRGKPTSECIGIPKLV